MGINSNIFIIFLVLCIIVYYAVSWKARWIVLLVASYGFYLYASITAVIFLAASTAITYIAALRIGRINELGESAENRRAAKGILIAGLILNMGILIVLKYSGFAVMNFNNIFSVSISLPRLILPLGISYYTFQTVGYMMDVYWDKTRPEKNPFKYALFVSFFPQLIQGPIGRFSTLAPQLFDGSGFDKENLKYGVTRIIWGLFKKMLIADWAAVYRSAIFNDPETYSGIAIFGVLLYSIELYGDFSGGIDVVIGVARLFGVKMDENFRQPFFSVSLSDFWTRWHITLGAWMRDYVFFPMSRSRWMKKYNRHTKKLFGKAKGRLIPSCLANIIVFLIVGIWHGPTWGFIGWGLFNGLIIAFSTLFESEYISVKSRLKINDASFGWRVFMILRTFAIINLSWYFECADSFEKAFRMIGYSVTRFTPSQFLQIAAGNQGRAYTPYALITIGTGVIILLIVGIAKERNEELYETLNTKLSPVIRFAVLFIMLSCIPLFGPMAQARGFLYAQF